MEGGWGEGGRVAPRQSVAGAVRPAPGEPVAGVLHAVRPQVPIDRGGRAQHQTAALSDTRAFDSHKGEFRKYL